MKRRLSVKQIKKKKRELDIYIDQCREIYELEKEQLKEECPHSYERFSSYSGTDYICEYCGSVCED
jgi:hypothetical protein